MCENQHWNEIRKIRKRREITVLRNHSAKPQMKDDGWRKRRRRTVDILQRVNQMCDKLNVEEINVQKHEGNTAAPKEVLMLPSPSDSREY